MVSIYYLSGFNNYYNRTILLPQATEIADYSDYTFIKVDEVENFNPNDNVMTELVVNYWEGTDFENGIPDITNIDYILISSDKINIDSKWFVLDRRRVRGQQWHFTLRRDLVSDNYNAVINSPCFIEKATLPADSPLLWNHEEMTFNQIKQSETLLKDASDCAWIVGYISSDTTSATGTNNIKPIGPELESLADHPLSAYVGNSKAQAKEAKQPMYVETSVFITAPDFDSTELNYSYVINETEQTVKRNNTTLNTGGYQQAPGKDQARINNTILITWPEATHTMYQPYFTNDTFMTEDIERQLKAEIGKIYQVGTKYYRIRVQQPNLGIFSKTAKIESGLLFNRYKTAIENANHNYSFLNAYVPNSNTFSMTIRYRRVEYYWEELDGDITVKATIGADRYHPYDAPYDIFAIPYTDGNVITSSGVISCSKDAGMAAAMGLIRDNPGKIYDIQLLPYCPVPYAINSNNELDITNVEFYDKIIIPPPSGTTTISATTIGVILYATESKLSIKIPLVIEVPTDATERKVMNECEMYRLCSPNYDGVFEFSPAKNGGVKEFNVDISFIPFSPYIHVNPDFGGMYGDDFDDARGLICGGDFSLPITTDQWEEYKIQNKNYQQIFNRQIENMNVNNSIQRKQEWAQTINGSITSGAMTAGSAMMLGGNPVVGAVAGVAGAGISLAGGIYDIYLNDKLRTEALDMARDQFGYSLGNIQALPHSLSRTTAYTNNNKIFPFVEKYSATETEKQALRDKLTYDGMTTMVVGKIADYKQATPSYIKGRLIRLLNSQTLDFHGLSELANEIYKGVFI